MVFRLVLVNHTPPTASDDKEAVAAALLRDIGLIPGGLEVPTGTARRRRGRPRDGKVVISGSADPPRPGEEVLASVPFRLMMDCFWTNPGMGFTVEELETRLGASRPTVYRHLLRLRELDLISLGEEDGAKGHRRNYQMRFSSPTKAWRFVEVNAECALDTLREMVDLVWKEAEPRKRKGESASNLILDHTSSRISFRLPVSEFQPLDRSDDEETHLIAFLSATGYLTSWSTSRGTKGVSEGLAYRIFKDCLLDRPDRSWTMRELQAVLHTSKPTLYRHLKRLESLDLLERGLRGESPRSSKAFRLRYGNLSKAWNFTEEHARQSLRSYRETVEHLERLLEEAGSA
jgi:DNA-binding transcriptional ArsR family regulator